MADRPTCIERAFALAKSGKCDSVKSVRQQLKAEGYSEAGHLSGNAIRRQLMALLATARAGKPDKHWGAHHTFSAAQPWDPG